jgi:hypothetical protein
MSLVGSVLISVSSVHPPCSRCLGGQQMAIKLHHRDTENSEGAQRLIQTHRRLPLIAGGTDYFSPKDPVKDPVNIS